jgi:hypothetical protein
MPLSYNAYTATSGQTVFAFTFPVLSQDHVKVSVNGADLASNQYTVATSPSSQVTLTSGATAGQIVRVYRQTPGRTTGAAVPLVDFVNGSVLSEDDLDKNSKQLLYLVQESDDTGSGALPKTVDELDWDAQSKKIRNLSTPVTGTDAASKSYVDNKFASDAMIISGGNFDAESLRINNVADPSANQDAATKKYVDDKFVSDAMILSGGHWDGETKKIQNVVDPTANQDAATKKYVDDKLVSDALILNGAVWDGESRRITNVSSPTNTNDAANKAYVDGVSVYGGGIASPQTWSFSGTGSQSTFTLASPDPLTTDTNMFLVEVGGVIQRPITNYNINAPNQLVFAAAPPSGTNNILVRNIGATRNVLAFNDALTFNGDVAMAADLNVDSGMFRVRSASNRVGVNCDPSVLFQVNIPQEGSITNVARIGVNNTNSLNFLAQGGNYMGIGYNLFSTAGNTYSYIGADRASLLRWQNGGFQFYGTGTTGTANGSATMSLLGAFTSDGRLGVNKSTPSTTLDVNGTATATAFSGPLTGNVTGDVTGNLTGTVQTAAQPNITSLGTLSSATISGNLTVDTNTLFVDAANNKVAIGTTTPPGSQKLHVEGDALIYNGRLAVVSSLAQSATFDSTGNTYIDLYRNGTQEVFLQATPTRALVGTANNKAFAISVVGSDRQLIDTSGSVMFGPATAIGSINANNPRGLTLYSPTSSANYMWYTGGNPYLAYFETKNTTSDNTTGFFQFIAANATVGTIKVNGSGVTYNTTSDYRLKKDVVPLAGALDRVCNMNPCSYTWKDSNRPSEGFLAHELAEVVPYAVSGSKDAVNGDGSILPQEVSLSNVVPVLAAAIKELKSLVDAQAARIAALEAAQA